MYSISGLEMTSSRWPMSEPSMKGMTCSKSRLILVRRNWEDLVSKLIKISTRTWIGFFLSSSFSFLFFFDCSPDSARRIFALISFYTISRSLQSSAYSGQTKKQKPTARRKLQKVTLNTSLSSLLALKMCRTFLMTPLTSLYCSPNYNSSCPSLERIREGLLCMACIFFGLDERSALKMVLMAWRADSSLAWWYRLMKTVMIWEIYSTVSYLWRATRKTSNQLQYPLGCFSSSYSLLSLEIRFKIYWAYW